MRFRIASSQALSRISRLAASRTLRFMAATLWVVPTIMLARVIHPRSSVS